MDSFTKALRQIVLNTVVEGAKSGIESMASKWGTSSRSNSKNKSTKTDSKTKDATTIFNEVGTLNADPLAKKKISNKAAQSGETTDDYSSIVKVAQNNGYTPTDAETDTLLNAIRNRNILNQGGETNPSVEEEDESDVVTYTYKPGDTFGQVLLDLGLSDGSRLWGSGGDVEFYTQQLKAQDMLDSRGNVKLGIPFKLRRRK